MHYVVNVQKCLTPKPLFSFARCSEPRGKRSLKPDHGLVALPPRMMCMVAPILELGSRAGAAAMKGADASSLTNRAQFRLTLEVTIFGSWDLALSAFPEVAGFVMARVVGEIDACLHGQKIELGKSKESNIPRMKISIRTTPTHRLPPPDPLLQHDCRCRLPPRSTPCKQEKRPTIVGRHAPRDPRQPNKSEGFVSPFRQSRTTTLIVKK